MGAAPATDPYGFRGLRHDGETAEPQDVSLDELRRLRDAGIALSETGLERLRAAEENAEVEADRRLAQAREATVRLAATDEACRAAQAEIVAAYETLVDAKERGFDARMEYDAAWRGANALGVESPRIEPGRLDRELSDRFTTVILGAKSSF